MPEGRWSSLVVAEVHYLLSLKHNIWEIQTSFPCSKWNMDEFFCLKFHLPCWSSLFLIINTQYMRNPDIVYVLKMEYGWNFLLRISSNNMHIQHNFFLKPFVFKHGPFCYRICNSGQKSSHLWCKSVDPKKVLRMEEFLLYTIIFRPKVERSEYKKDP